MVVYQISLPITISVRRMSIPTDAEIKQVIFAMGANRSPDHDGLNATFFKVCWDIISAEFYALIKEFFINNCLPSGANHTLLVLIAKKHDVLCAADNRLISLSTITYKTIAKIIAN